jgi:hypothetical protein
LAPESRTFSWDFGSYRLEETFTMKTNEAGWDRTVRVVFGLALLALTVIGPQTPWGFVGIVLVTTGIWGFCPLYRVFG